MNENNNELERVIEFWKGNREAVEIFLDKWGNLDSDSVCFLNYELVRSKEQEIAFNTAGLLYTTQNSRENEGRSYAEFTLNYTREINKMVGGSLGDWDYEFKNGDCVFLDYNELKKERCFYADYYDSKSHIQSTIPIKISIPCGELSMDFVSIILGGTETIISPRNKSIETGLSADEPKEKELIDLLNELSQKVRLPIT